MTANRFVVDASVVMAWCFREEGTGYAERLELSIRPWRLPIRELRWGRFVSEGASMAWIDWQGADPTEVIRALGYEPGKEESPDVTEDRRRQVLEDLDSGKLSADAAMRILRGEEV